MIKGISKFSIFASFTLFLFLSCDRDVVFSDSMDMDNNTWKLMDIATFNVTVPDTINSNNLWFTIRTGSDYPFRNIWLFVTTTSPDGRIIGDTIQYFLAGEHGKRLGKGFGDIRELILPYKSNVYFPRKGDYRFRIQHGMRTEDLRGVYDFGLRIEKITR